MPVWWNGASQALNPFPASLSCCCPLSEPSWREISLLGRAQVIRLKTGGHLSKFPSHHYICSFCHAWNFTRSRQQRSRGARVLPPQLLFPGFLSKYFCIAFSCLYSSKLIGSSFGLILLSLSCLSSTPFLNWMSWTHSVFFLPSPMIRHCYDDPWILFFWVILLILKQQKQNRKNQP